MKKILLHDNLLVRFIALYLLGLTLFLIAWTLSYYFLPVGFIREGSIAAKFSGNEANGSFTHEFIKILAFNLFSTSIIVIANWSTSIRDYPLGYLIPVIWFIYYALLLGTNSFNIPMPHRLAPSLTVFGRSGLYEMASYILIAVSTYKLPRYRANRLFFATYEKVNGSQKLSTTQWTAITLAVIILILSNLWEAEMILTI